MSNVTIELNSAGVRELLQSAAIRQPSWRRLPESAPEPETDTRLRRTRQRSERLRE